MSEPTAPISSKPRCERADALVVLKRLREAGHVAYFAGGCVRDELMGLVPKDYDVATDAPPARVRELFTNTQAVGAAFGVILVRQRKSVVEVATFRTDVSYEDGRRPTAVRFTTAEEDARRRDFTINGLFLDPIENRVIDYVGGQADIRSQTIRAIGDPSHRFDEDHLRLLRAVRFASRFGFEIEAGTRSAIESHAPKLARISPERIADELRLTFVPPQRGRAWQLLVELKLLPVVLREFPQNPWLGFVDKHSRPLFPELAPGRDVSFGLALAALVWCYRSGTVPSLALTTRAEARRSVAACRKLLRISNDEANLMHECLELNAFLDDDRPPTIAMLKRLMSKPSFPEIRMMVEAFQKSGHFVPRVTWLMDELDRLSGSEVAPVPLVTGDDLVARGLQPGPAFKRALDFVYDEQLEGRVTTREQALELGERKVREFEVERAPR
jgi:poly(A) polymerase